MFPTWHGAWGENHMARDVRPEMDMKDPGQQSVLAPLWTCGGFMEDRTKLWAGFEPATKSMVHLGVDFSAPAGTPIAAPRDAVVVDVLRDPSPFNGWGGRVVLKLGEWCLYKFVVLGHLDPARLTLRVGDGVKRGEIVGYLGSAEVNGGWFPHLHLQQMSVLWRDFDGYAEADLPVLKWVCDPSYLVK